MEKSWWSPAGAFPSQYDESGMFGVPAGGLFHQTLAVKQPDRFAGYGMTFWEYHRNMENLDGLFPIGKPGLESFFVKAILKKYNTMSTVDV